MHLISARPQTNESYNIEMQSEIESPGAHKQHQNEQPITRSRTHTSHGSLSKAYWPLITPQGKIGSDLRGTDTSINPFAHPRLVSQCVLKSAGLFIRSPTLADGGSQQPVPTELKRPRNVQAALSVTWARRRLSPFNQSHSI